MTEKRFHPVRWAIAAGVLVVAVIAIIFVTFQREPVQPADDFARPADVVATRPGFHVSPPDGLMNDPQKPVFVDGLWHLYYLYNADHPDGNGTSWRHITSENLVTWSDEGVAIEKFDNGWGDVETGTVVVDESNDAGYGAGALIATMTQQLDGVQRQSLFHSDDGGYSFTSAAENPVMENPGVTHFRDPRIIRDDANDQWVMILAEGARLGFYTSSDLHTWKYGSDFPTENLGILECPDLFPLAVNGEPDRLVWVLVASANNSAAGGTTGVAYWTGTWRDGAFTRDSDEPLWMDAGPDYYAAVSWDDPRRPAAQRADGRYTLGWLNNWSYARELPDSTWTHGALSVTRTLTLTDDGNGPRLSLAPIPAIDALAGPPVRIHEGALAGRSDSVAAPGDTTSFRIDATVDRGDAGSIDIHLGGAAGESVTLSYNFATDQLSVDRHADTTAALLPSDSGYATTRSGDATSSPDDPVRLTVLVDTSSVEVFTDDGLALSALVNLGTGTPGVSLETHGGPAEIDEATMRAMSPSQLLSNR